MPQSHVAALAAWQSFDASGAISPEHRKAASVRVAHGPVALDFPDVMLYVVDSSDNKSKFYEMAVVEYSNAHPARQEKNFAGGGTNLTLGSTLMKRWGRLTDSASTGRVDSLNEHYATRDEAWRAMEVWKQKKIRESGYTDVSQEGRYPIGLGGAGFGWGGQAAHAKLEVFERLQSDLRRAEEAVDNAIEDMRPLMDRSSMAEKFRGLLTDAQAELGRASRFLDSQLMHHDRLVRVK